jgi:hypothetical protein
MVQFANISDRRYNILHADSRCTIQQSAIRGPADQSRRAIRESNGSAPLLFD